MSTQENPYVIRENAKRPGTVVVAVFLVLIGLLNLFAAVAARLLSGYRGSHVDLKWR